MLETLLWSCPICKSHDAIKHSEHRFRNDEVNCSECGAQWDLIRVVGGPDFRLKLNSSNNGGSEKALSEWYDQMMGNLKFEPLENPLWPLPGNHLPLETLYLHSQVLLGFASPDDPVFLHPGIEFPSGDNTPMGMKPIGPGQLFFTSQRLLFVLPNGIVISLSWDHLNSVDTLMDKIFSVGFNDRLFGFVLKGQSVLKWLAYTRYWINQNLNGNGHRIYQGFV